jgi:shikimate 5-dehydrogenase
MLSMKRIQSFVTNVNGFFTALDFPQKDRLYEFLSTLLSFPECTDITITNPYKKDAYLCMKQFQINHFHIEIADRVHHLECLNHIIPDYRNKIIYVDNTDGHGMILALKKQRDLEGRQVLLVGAGGAAAAIGYELVKAGAELLITNIIEEDAKSLEKKLSFFNKPGHSIHSGGWDQIREWAPLADIIISTITTGSMEEKCYSASLSWQRKKLEQFLILNKQ